MLDTLQNTRSEMTALDLALRKKTTAKFSTNELYKMVDAALLHVELNRKRCDRVVNESLTLLQSTMVQLRNLYCVNEDPI